MKRKTVGVDPKVPAQLLAAAVAWVLLHFTGIELSVEVETALAALIGAAVGALAPAPNVIDRSSWSTVHREDGQAGIALLVVLLLILIFVVWVPLHVGPLALLLLLLVVALLFLA